MARLNDMKIFLEIEPLVKMTCRNSECKNNLHRRGYVCCGLKYVDIDKNGKCMNCEIAETGDGQSN